MSIPYNFINIGVWNIHGLFVKVNEYRLNKLEDPEFIKRLGDFDILCLQETQCGPQATQSLSVQRKFDFNKKVPEEGSQGYRITEW